MTTKQETLAEAWEVAKLTALILVISFFAMFIVGPRQVYRDIRDLLTGNYESKAWGEECEHDPVGDLDPQTYNPGDKVTCDDCGLGFVVQTDDFRGKRYFVAGHVKRAED